jgi:putative phosphoesterase
MRIAALYDIHGNLPALEAVLAEVEREAPDAIVVGGDVAPGWLVDECVARLRALGARFVTGNGDREAGLPGFEPLVRLDGVLFCHGSPRSDEEMITTLTPDARLAPMLAGVEEQVIVCGHTHRQFDRRVGGRRVVNAGAVGLPYEGAAGAFWLLLEDGEPELRRTGYDLDAAVERLRASDNPQFDELLGESLLEPTDPDEVAAHFERQAAEPRA